MMSGNEPAELAGPQGMAAPIVENVATISLDPTHSMADAAATAIEDAAIPQRFQSTAEFEAWLVEAAVSQWAHLFGQSTFGYWDFDQTVFDLAIPRMTLSSGVAEATLNAFSTTNLQVMGVDEADFVETDGQFLYTSFPVKN